jgi:hypothetical protein
MSLPTICLSVINPLRNYHYRRRQVNKVDASLAKLPGLDKAPAEFYAVLNFTGLHFADPDRNHLLTLPFVQIYRWCVLQSTMDPIIEILTYSTIEILTYSTIEVATYSTTDRHLSLPLLLLVFVLHVPLCRGASDIQLWLDVKKVSASGDSEMVRVHLATVHAVPLCGLMLEIINAILVCSDTLLTFSPPPPPPVAAAPPPPPPPPAA